MTQFVKGVYRKKNTGKIDMMEEKQMLEALKRLMNKRYLEWQQKIQERKTITEFADYLGFPQSTVSFWMNGARLVKKKEDIEQLASSVGFAKSFEYPVLKLKRGTFFL